MIYFPNDDQYTQHIQNLLLASHVLKVQKTISYIKILKIITHYVF